MQLWELPSNYMGPNWSGYYLCALHHRDSGLLVESNWNAHINRLTAIEPESIEEDSGIYKGWHIVRDSHFAVGWIEYVLINKDNQKLVEAGNAIQKELDDYLILDESDYYERVMEATEEYWKSSDIRNRIWTCKQAGVSILNARKNEINELPERLQETIDSIVDN